MYPLKVTYNESRYPQLRSTHDKLEENAKIERLCQPILDFLEQISGIPFSNMYYKIWVTEKKRTKQLRHLLHWKDFIFDSWSKSVVEGSFSWRALNHSFWGTCVFLDSFLFSLTYSQDATRAV